MSDCVSPGGILKGEAGESNHIVTTCDNQFRYMIYVPMIIIYQFGFRAGQDKCTEIPAEGQLTWANSPIRCSEGNASVETGTCLLLRLQWNITHGQALPSGSGVAWINQSCTAAKSRKHIENY